MPKAAKFAEFPLNGLFPIEKPSGPTSMKVIDMIKPLLCESRLFHDPNEPMTAESKKQKKKKKGGLKIGQGGTLDPLADGVLVIGVGRGTKLLQDYLMGPKEYVATGLLGCSTTTFDSEGPVLSTAPWKHINREILEAKLDRFRGPIVQVPPIFSALKMDGKPLHEYARENKPLPRPIEGRSVTISSLTLETFQPASVVPGDGGHDFKWPDKHLSEEERETYRKLTEITKAAGMKADKKASDGDSAALADDQLPSISAVETKVEEGTPPCFRLRMTVSSGTYVRSIIHDLGLALGSAAHVVTLQRTQQGRFKLEDDMEIPVGTNETSEAKELVWGQKKGGCVPWAVWQRAIDEHKAENASNAANHVPKTAPAGDDEEEAMAMAGQQDLAEEEWQPKEWEKEMYARFISV